MLIVPDIPIGTKAQVKIKIGCRIFWFVGVTKENIEDIESIRLGDGQHDWSYCPVGVKGSNSKWEGIP